MSKTSAAERTVISAPVNKRNQKPEDRMTSLELRLGKLGRLVGFEPTTSAATERRSATEL